MIGSKRSLTSCKHNIISEYQLCNNWDPQKLIPVLQLQFENGVRETGTGEDGNAEALRDVLRDVLWTERGDA